jgi:Outer membrane efflux protein
VVSADCEAYIGCTHRRSTVRSVAWKHHRPQLVEKGSLTAYRESQRRRADIARSVTENLAALQAARQRYSEGAIDFLNVISTQAQLLQSENDLADSDTQIATNLVNLYRALGGGWEVADVASGDDRAPP